MKGGWGGSQAMWAYTETQGCPDHIELTLITILVKYDAEHDIETQHFFNFISQSTGGNHLLSRGFTWDHLLVWVYQGFSLDWTAPNTKDQLSFRWPGLLNIKERSLPATREHVFEESDHSQYQYLASQNSLPFPYSCFIWGNNSPLTWKDGVLFFYHSWDNFFG